MNLKQIAWALVRPPEADDEDAEDEVMELPPEEPMNAGQFESLVKTMEPKGETMETNVFSQTPTDTPPPQSDLDKVMAFLDTVLGEMANALPYGRGKLACKIAQSFVEVIVPMIWPKVKPMLAAKGVKVS